jgi:hypothetical protein
MPGTVTMGSAIGARLHMRTHMAIVRAQKGRMAL